MDVIILTSGPLSSGPTKFLYRYIGPYKIAHFCRNYGYDVQVIDFVNFMSEEQLYYYITKFIVSDTAIIALSCTFLFYKLYAGGASKNDMLLWPEHLLAALQRIKAEYPNVHIVLGGYNCNLVVGHDIVDSAIMNYGEDIFLELVEHLKLGSDEPEYQMASIGDSNEMRKIYNKSKKIRHDIQIDSHVFYNNDCIMPQEVLPIEISRGCIFSCKFCHHLLLGRGKMDYLRSFECIRAEIMENYNKWKITSYYVICDTFNDTLEKMQKWHDMIMSLPFKIKYTCYLRADLIERFPEQAHILQQTGLYSAFHGLESFGQQASYTIGKAWSGKKAKEYIPRLYHDIWGDQVKQVNGFIIGLPGDTRETIKDTINWYKENDLYGIVLEPLNLSNNKHSLARFSEFEKNYEKYDYKFGDDRNNWILPYWDKNQVLEFHTNFVRPTIDPINAWYTSWQVMALYSCGIYEIYPLLANKQWQQANSYRWQDIQNEINDLTDQFLQKYFQKLAAV